MVASSLGATFEIGLSSLLSNPVHDFSLGFGVLALIHRGCNYASLKPVPLAHLIEHRPHLMLEHCSRNIRGQKQQA
jgi:hypothetical protein